ncbi:MAG: hypothetical protein BRD26_05270 [Bacteroidetes bacterium QH_1_64_81]|nr:MAG: hypothetical protein BRD26_05270 [Bacteroidetes bacterium QH_1_64_81]
MGALPPSNPDAPIRVRVDRAVSFPRVRRSTSPFKTNPFWHDRRYEQTRFIQNPQSRAPAVPGRPSLGVVLHEGLHGLGHVRGEATWDDVRFGMHWKALTPFAQCMVPTRARAYRIALALPGLVLGAVPLALGVSTGIWLVTFFGFLMLVAAAGDVLILWVLRGVPPRAWVQDHPRQVGCLVVAGAESPSPAPVSEDDLPDDTTNGDELSFIHLLALAALSAVCAAIGFLIALG